MTRDRRQVLCVGLFFSVVLLLGGTSAQEEPIGAADCGDVVLPVFYESAKLLANAGYPGDRFGSAIAMDGDIAVIAARHDQDNGREAGAVYAYARGGDGWIEEAKLLASDGLRWDQFGHDVDLSGDTLVVGAPSTRIISPPIGFNPGAAYVFVRDGDGWTEQAKLLASDGRKFDRFGFSVAIAGDVIVVGATDNSELSCGSGSAYVFERSGSTWTETAKLLASDTSCNQRFGSSAAMSGRTVVIGARGDQGGFGNFGGSAYVFTRGPAGWTQEAKIRASNASPSAFFGDSVGIDHDTIVVGAPNHVSGDGAAYAFRRGASGWTEEARLVPSWMRCCDRLGFFVGTTGDLALVGAIFDDEVARNAGTAYLFHRGEGGWTERAELLASDGSELAHFGSSAAASRGTLFVGAPEHKEGGTTVGAVYVFELGARPGSWDAEELAATP